jgi:hypothetical protein
LSGNGGKRILPEVWLRAKRMKKGRRAALPHFQRICISRAVSW